MCYLILFFMVTGLLGSVIGHMVETSFSATAEVLIGVGMIATVWVVIQMALRVIKPCLTAIDEAVRFGEESAGR
ncbi:MAG: hypothetical protein HYT64_01090 [Candidatus Yanofskybacteria bacterium]|nr:hypothetical protein [Candidatus Yanofskybacteria bacterium]